MVKLLAVSSSSKVQEVATDVAVLELTVSINPPGNGRKTDCKLRDVLFIYSAEFYQVCYMYTESRLQKHEQFYKTSCGSLF